MSAVAPDSGAWLSPGATWAVLLLAAVALSVLVWLLARVLDAMFSAPGAPESDQEPEPDLEDPLAPWIAQNRSMGPPPWKWER